MEEQPEEKRRAEETQEIEPSGILNKEAEPCLTRVLSEEDLPLSLPSDPRWDACWA